jgi:hypothetical protein
MPTPMRKLLNWMEENPFNLNIPVQFFDMVKILCEEEKIELIKSREDGIYIMINGSAQEKQITSEEYYNKLNEEKN